MDDRQEHRPLSNRLLAIALVVFAAVIAYLFWPSDFGTVGTKMIAIGSVVLVAAATLVAVLIW